MAVVGAPSSTERVRKTIIDTGGDHGPRRGGTGSGVASPPALPKTGVRARRAHHHHPAPESRIVIPYLRAVPLRRRL